MNATVLDPARLDWGKGDGLLPLIVQHAHDGRVLMLGYTDRGALEHTLATREVHFWSRSKQRLWRKGESSGHVLALVSIVGAVALRPLGSTIADAFNNLSSTITAAM